MKAVMWGCFKAAEAVGRAVWAGSWSIQLLSTSPCLSTPFFQSYLSCCLLLSSFGSKWTAFIHTCHVTQQYCTEWVGFTAESCVSMQCESMLISASLSEKEKAGKQGFAETMGDPEWLQRPSFFPSFSQTYCSPWSSDGRECRTAVVCFITSQNSWAWQNLWVHPKELGSSQEMLRNGPLLLQPLLCCSFQPLQLFLVFAYQDVLRGEGHTTWPCMEWLSIALLLLSPSAVWS